MAWITSINGVQKSIFTGKIRVFGKTRVFGEFEDINGDKTLVTVDGDNEQECVEHLANMQTEKEGSPYYRLVMYSEISTDSWS